ncbi:MAG: outer membrane protein multidrug efflux system [Bryobacterales bacterium]|nr:outer membrane protein multidrug efflux system [Bryobacterales bacterium]
MRRIAIWCGVGLSGLLMAGCAVGPNYQRPAVAAPPQFRGVSNPSEPVVATSLADTKWFDLFQDEKLTDLVKTALAQNYDLRIASARVLEARAQLGITRADLFPTLSGSGSFNSNRPSSVGATTFIPKGTDLSASYHQVGFTLGWELDVWGRIRRLTEAARAQYLGSEEARHAVVTTLIADVSTNYFNLRESDMELAIANQTLTDAQNGLRLTSLRLSGGTATALDVRQAEQLLYTATAEIAASQRQIEQSENLLSLLTARNPQAVARGKDLTELTAPPAIPAGIPSALLERRPDIRQAEQSLVAANANIGAARAQYFPQIDLTGFLGGQSRALTSLFTGPARDWSFVPGVTVPIFNAGRIRSGVRLTEAQKQEALASYEKSIQTGFREVADSLVGYRKISEQRAQEELFVTALRDSVRLANLRYRGGLESYLPVLDAERNLFQGELQLARLKRDELVSVVNLYRALGGGWQ